MKDLWERVSPDILPSWMKPRPGMTFREYVEWDEALHFDWIVFLIHTGRR